MDSVIPGIDPGFFSQEPNNVTTTVQLLLLLTVLSLAPALLILMTSFTRIIIVLSFVRHSLATQQMPPNQVLIGLALFLTFFIMGPIFSDVNQNAIQPYIEGDISQEEALDRTAEPIKQFMAKETRQKDLELFLGFGQYTQPETLDDIPLTALVPAFVISELKTAFQMGFMIYVPFLIIDMVVSSILMSMGMMMLPPVMISLPFKVLLFIMVDGWYLIVESLLNSYN